MTNKITQNIHTRNLSLSWLFTFAEGQDYNSGSGSFHSDSNGFIVHSAHPVHSQACIYNRDPAYNAVLFAVSIGTVNIAHA